MELLVRNSSVASGGSKGEYSILSGEVIDSNVSTQTHINTRHAITSKGPEIAEISSSTTTKTVFWVRFDSGRELKYTINSEIDLLKGQRVSLLFVDGKSGLSRLVGIVNHNSMQYTNLADRKKYVECLRPNRGKTINRVLLLLTAALTKYYVYDYMAENNVEMFWSIVWCFFAGSLIYFGLFWVIAISLLVADTHYRTFKKEVNKNLVGVLQGG
ncbi:TPA: hypothetical protein NKY93_002790 [Vibrio parahaemolyticus]|nr:hypothetical protein [Vibrio parahaemolyticus]HCH5255523.1 hypothetical protein [Vibrio parahaemolyticus]